MSANDLDLVAENLIGGLRAHGYLVTVRPIPGMEAEYVAALRKALSKVDETMTFIGSEYRTRGMSKRALGILHRLQPEPGFGIQAPSNST